MALLRLILIGLLIYLVIKFFIRLLFLYIGSGQNKEQSDFERNSHGSKKKEGEVTVEGIDKNDPKKIKKDEGDYVDYEEI